jgi:hypothetical protein
MRLVAFGILTAMLFGAGCALQAGDPGEAAGPSTELTTSQTTPRTHESVTPTGAGSAVAPNPEPSPWFPTDPGMADDSTGSNPEPSPWHPDTPTAAAGTSTDPQGGGGGAGSTSGNAGSTPNRPGHHGSL